MTGSAALLLVLLLLLFELEELPDVDDVALFDSSISFDTETRNTNESAR